jgi:hypothetical protein
MHYRFGEETLTDPRRARCSVGNNRGDPRRIRPPDLRLLIEIPEIAGIFSALRAHQTAEIAAGPAG